MYNMKSIFNKIKNWIAVDGLLHLLVSALVFMLLTPFVKVWVALFFTAFIGIGKEIYDFFIKKSNNRPQVIHDLICDCIGIFIGLVSYIINLLV